MNHYTCLVVGALCMFKWLPCFALPCRKSGNACCNHFFFRKTVDTLYRADPPRRSSGTLLLTFADVWDSQHRGPPDMH